VLDAEIAGMQQQSGRGGEGSLVSVQIAAQYGMAGFRKMNPELV
jgi:hypothetical protein